MQLYQRAGRHGKGLYKGNSQGRLESAKHLQNSFFGVNSSSPSISLTLMHNSRFVQSCPAGIPPFFIYVELSVGRLPITY
jgi:hypothetical protein